MARSYGFQSVEHERVDHLRGDDDFPQGPQIDTGRFSVDGAQRRADAG